MFPHLPAFNPETILNEGERKIGSCHGAAKGSIAVGVALLSANTISLAYGNSTTISSVGGFPTANWSSGAPGAAMSMQEQSLMDSL